MKIIRTTSACPTNEIGDLQKSEGNDFDEAVSLKTFLDQVKVNVYMYDVLVHRAYDSLHPKLNASILHLSAKGRWTITFFVGRDYFVL